MNEWMNEHNTMHKRHLPPRCSLSINIKKPHGTIIELLSKKKFLLNGRNFMSAMIARFMSTERRKISRLFMDATPSKFDASRCSLKFRVNLARLHAT